MTAKAEDWRKQLAALVKLPSVSSLDPAWDQSNAAVVERLADWLGDLGFCCEVQHIPDVPGRAGDKVNLVATLGRGDGGLVLAGHTDTVPFDASLWQSDPFEVREADGRVHGLGTTDMKGFFPLALAAARSFSAGDLGAPLVLLATADEESSMGGARDLVARGRSLGTAAIVGEPTCLRPVRAHKGFMVREIHVRGRSGHSSNPALGLCAMTIMHSVIGELMALRESFAQRYRNPLFEVPYPTLNLGCIHGGDNPNRICSSCELKIDMRLLPGMDAEEACAQVQARLDRIADRSGGIIESALLAPPVPAWEADEDSPLVRAAERLTGNAAGSAAFSTESPFFKQLGMDAVVLGPGDIDTAHQPDECLDIAAAETMIEVLRGAIRHHCIDLPGRARA